MIQEYNSLLRQLDESNMRYKSLRSSISKLESNERNLKTSLQRLRIDKEQAISEVRKSLIEEARKRKIDPLQARLGELQQNLQNLDLSFDEKNVRIQADDYLAKHSESFKLIKQGRDLLKTFDSANIQTSPLIIEGVKTSLTSLNITDTMVLAMYNRVSEYKDMEGMILKMPMLESVAKKIFLPNRTYKSSTFEILSVGLKSIALIGVLAIVPALVMIPYSLVLVPSIVRKVKNTEELSKLIYPLEFLREMIDRRVADLELKCEEEKKQDLLDTETYYMQQKNECTSQIEQLENQINRLSNDRIENLDEAQVERIVDKKYVDKVKKIEEDLRREAGAIEKRNENLLKLDKEIRDLRLKKAKLKEQIESVMLNLESVGTSQLLLKSFFLGFDEEDRVISMQYDGDTSLVIYSEDDSRTVIPFLQMMIIQFFTNMSPNSLHIDIVDLDNAGIDYNVFRYGNLTDVINIVASKSEESALLSSLHKDMRTRSERISSIADSIEEYNEIMLNRESIPMEYEIVIFQAMSDDIYGNKELLQICRQGARNGIVLIFFVQNSKMAFSSAPNKDSSKMENMYDFVSAIPKQFFNYNAVTGEVSDLGVEYKQGYLQDLSKLIMEAK